MILFDSYHVFSTDAAPNIITQPIEASAAAPFSAMFTCSAKGCGELELDVIWHRQNGPLPQKAYSTMTTSVNETTSTLTIPNVAIEDIGTYYCVVWASNIATQSRMANLHLAGKACFEIMFVFMTLLRSTVTTSSSSCSCSKSYC